MRVLSCFSGVGLGDYGLELAGMTIVGQIEIDEYCQKILKLRWPDVPKWGNIKSVTGKEIIEKCGRIDLISGGVPCQPFSTAGKRNGETDSRHLWPHMARIIREVKPRYVLAENVPGLLSISDGRVFGEVVRDLAESGYCVEWDCIPASALGAPHRRDRVWIMAYAEMFGCDESRNVSEQSDGASISRTSKTIPKRVFAWQARATRGCQGLDSDSASKRLPDWAGGEVGQPSPLTEFERPSSEDDDAYTEDKGSLRRNRSQTNACKKIRGKNWKRDIQFQEIERVFCRMADGPSPALDGLKLSANSQTISIPVTNRVDRLKLLGNGQVVQVVCWIGTRIMEFDSEFPASRTNDQSKLEGGK